jgi:uncharacterized protein with HEPN domain
MPLDDDVRLRHMHDAARQAVAFCDGMAQAQFAADARTWRATLQCVQVIGEAANHVSETAKAALPQMPWREMTRMRHRLVHHYFDVNLAILWAVVQDDLPPLIEALDRHLRNIRDE